MQVTPINGFFGAEISGIDLRKPLSDTEYLELRAAFVRYEVIVLRGQAITLDQQMAFGRRFGELSIHPFSPNLGDKREVIKIDHGKDNPPSLTDVWHTDETFRENPPMATMLRCLEAPQAGGDTVFASMTAAYRGLSERMKSHIHGLEAQHDFKPWRDLFNTPELKVKLRELEDRFPNPWHPVVRVHPESGKRVLFVTPQFCVRIKDMKADESKAILEFLYLQAHVPEYQMRVKWQRDTIVMWDNRSVQHYASFDYYPQPRKMERLTITGDLVVGVTGPYVPETIAGNGTVMPPAAASGGGARTRDFQRS
jgi:taurine dioxygenase